MNKVGYRRPPGEHRFKPGQSGNPKGRPKGARGLAQIIDEVLGRRMKIRDRDTERRVTVTEALVLRLVQKGLSSGDIRAIAYLLERVREPAPDADGATTALTADDAAIVSQFLNRSIGDAA